MAMRRPRTRRPRARRARRAPRRRTGRRIPGPLRTAFSTKRTLYSANYTNVPTGGTNFQLDFNLNQMPSAGEFTALFDEYKINAVKVTIFPRGNSAENTTGNGSRVFSIVDYDDSTAPSGLNELLQYPGVKSTALTQPHVRYIKTPKVASAVYQSALVTAYGARSMWLDCASSTIPHYGVKFWCNGTNSGTVILDLQIDYFVSFRGVR